MNNCELFPAKGRSTAWVCIVGSSVIVFFRVVCDEFVVHNAGFVPGTSLDGNCALEGTRETSRHLLVLAFEHDIGSKRLVGG